MSTNGTHRPDPAIVREAITQTPEQHALGVALPRLAAAALANPDWRAKCHIEQCEDGSWVIRNPERTHWWNQSGNAWCVEVNSSIGVCETAEEAANDIANCEVPYPTHAPVDSNGKSVVGLATALGMFPDDHTIADSAIVRDRQPTPADPEVCEDCGGTGHMQIITATNGTPIPTGYVGFERCDACEKYDSDLAAAAAYGLRDIRDHGSGLIGRLPVTDDGSPSHLPEDDQPRRTAAATLAAMPELLESTPRVEVVADPTPTCSLAILGELHVEVEHGIPWLYSASGIRVARILSDESSHLDPKQRIDQVTSKTVANALVSLWNASMATTRRLIDRDRRQKLRDNAN